LTWPYSGIILFMYSSREQQFYSVFCITYTCWEIFCTWLFHFMKWIGIIYQYQGVASSVMLWIRKCFKYRMSEWELRSVVVQYYGHKGQCRQENWIAHHITFDVLQYCFTNAYCIAVFSKTKLYILPFVVAVCDVLFGLLIISSSNPKFLFWQYYVIVFIEIGLVLLFHSW
jgi:hypothetical protein